MKAARTLFWRSGPLVAIPLVAFLYGSSAWATPILGSELASFAVLGASDVTCVATCFIGGNVGSFPTAPTSAAANFSFSFGSFQPGTQGLAQNPQLDDAISAVNAHGPGTTITGGDLDAWQLAHGNVIIPGTYTVPALATNLVGNLFLDGAGSNSAAWYFLFTSTLITSTISNVSVQNVGDGANVGLYWTVGSSATLNGPTFAGNVLAEASITSDGDLTLNCGRLLADTGNVTLIMDKISTGCVGTGFEKSGGFSGGTTVASNVPEPSSLLLLITGLIGVVTSMGLNRRAKPTPEIA